MTTTLAVRIVAGEFEPTAVLTVPMLLSVATTARVLDCSPRTVRRRIAMGELPAMIEHGRTMVRADELREYIDQLERVGGGGASPRRAHRHTESRFDFLRDSTPPLTGSD